MTARTPAFLAAALVAVSMAAGVTDIAPAYANSELDRRFALDTIGYLKAWDNMDGLFSEYVASAYREYFSKHSRFVLQDLSKTDVLLSKSKIPYVKLIEDKEILGQLARSMRSESIIRTKVYKEGPRYRFVIDWLHAPGMELLSTETFTVDEPRGGKPFGDGNVKETMHKALDRLIAKIPFIAHVTGRDEGSVTVNIGRMAKVKKGDQMIVVTLDEVKKHPLLGAIVDWRFSQTGKVEVADVDDGMAFCVVVEEDDGRQISRYQKVSRLMPAPPPAPLPLDDNGKKKSENDSEQYKQPSLGFGEGSLLAGIFSRQYSTAADTKGKSGGGFFYGGKATGNLWITRAFFLEAVVAYGFSTYSQSDIATGAETAVSGVTPSLFHWRGNLGYTHFLSGDIFGAKGWIKAGYFSTSYTLPVSNADSLLPVSFSGPILGVGGDLSIRRMFGAMLSFDIGVFSSGSETGTNANAVSSSSTVGLYAGGYWRYQPNIMFKFGMDLMNHTADFANGYSLTHRVIAFGPSAVYYF
ncbi:MAG: hypothetical protein A2583_08015 [Bdellovibrionales bacterium RIFOXYD1_FULL_53_11]|nr:MAG: hypothetical protein A2583_08015 [Bdellovibrionales bacterium RIFOXYD1_FULL_53_11]